MIELCLKHPVSLLQLEQLRQALDQQLPIRLWLQGASSQALAEQSPIQALSSEQQACWLEARQACWTHPQLNQVVARVSGVWPELEWLWQVASWQAAPNTSLLHAAPFWGLVSGLALSLNYGSTHPLASLHLQAGLCLPVELVHQISKHQLPDVPELEPWVQAPLRERARLWQGAGQAFGSALASVGLTNSGQQVRSWSSALAHAMTQASALALVCAYWQAKHSLPLAMACQRDWQLMQGLWQEGELGRSPGRFLYPSLIAIPYGLLERMLHVPAAR